MIVKFPSHERYSRQILFSGIGENGQEKLAHKRVVILGCGGLGSVSAEILARAGIGFLKIIDQDFLELSNLQRQVLFDENDVKEGLPKAIAAQRKLKQINSEVSVEAIVDHINRLNIEKYLHNIDLVIDATDNFPTRFLLNEMCVKNDIPWIFGACVESYGLTMNIIPQKTPCFRCVFDKLPDPEFTPTCETVGIISPIVNVIASIQCAEALKILTDNNHHLNDALLSIDLWKNDMQKIDISTANEQNTCPVCVYKQFHYLTGKYGSSYTSQYGPNAIQIIPFAEKELDLMALAIKLSNYGDPMYNEYVLRVDVENYQVTVFQNGRTIVKGTIDTDIARAIHAKYIEN